MESGEVEGWIREDDGACEGIEEEEEEGALVDDRDGEDVDGMLAAGEQEGTACC